MKYMTVQRLKTAVVGLVIAALSGLVLWLSFNRCSTALNDSGKVADVHLSGSYAFTKSIDKEELEALRKRNSILESKVVNLSMKLQDIESNSVTHLRSSDLSSKLYDEYNTLTSSFENTLRNCLGMHCFDMKPDKSMKDAVGLLAPPLSGGQEILSAIEQSGASLTSRGMYMEYDTHVPAYGYGKNHGWSRIIRIVRQPIPHAFSLLKHVILSGNIGTEGKLILGAQVRQLVRWHCRLSHVAAHTKMLTVFVDDILQRPHYELEKIMTFSGLKMPDRKRVVEAGKNLKSTLSVLFAPYLNVSSTLETVEKKSLDISFSALHEELVGTGYLTQWPCRSFRNIIKDESINQKLPIAAENLAANCSDPRVTCSVGFDRKGG